MSHGRLCVVKVGGSLLSWEGLEQALRRWLQSEEPATHVLVVGGGAAADTVRATDARLGLPAEQSHWLAVQAMGQSARLVHCLLPEAVMVDCLATMRSTGEAAPLIIVDTEPLLRQDEDALGPEILPHSWQATSDSIAARIAKAIGADELVLLKSAPMQFINWQGASEAGYVDAYFPVASASLPAIRAVNLRDVTIETAPPGAGLGNARNLHSQLIQPHATLSAKP